MSELIGLKQVAEILNFPEEEVMELVRQNRIPYLYYPASGQYFFHKEGVLAKIAPRPKKEPEMVIEEQKKEPVVERRGRPKKQK